METLLNAAAPLVLLAVTGLTFRHVTGADRRPAPRELTHEERLDYVRRYEAHTTGRMA